MEKLTEYRLTGHLPGDFSLEKLKEKHKELFPTGEFLSFFSDKPNNWFEYSKDIFKPMSQYECILRNQKTTISEYLREIREKGEFPGSLHGLLFYIFYVKNKPLFQNMTSILGIDEIDLLPYWKSIHCPVWTTMNKLDPGRFFTTHAADHPSNEGKYARLGGPFENPPKELVFNSYSAKSFLLSFKLIS